MQLLLDIVFIDDCFVNFREHHTRGVREQIFRTNSLPFQRLYSHSHPIPILWMILLPFPWESNGTHGIPVFPILMHTSTSYVLHYVRYSTVVVCQLFNKPMID